MLVHVVKRGDTWELLARQYGTSMVVLQAINPRGGREFIWEGEPLVILPGVKDAAGLGPLKATMIDGHWEISSQFPSPQIFYFINQWARHALIIN